MANYLQPVQIQVAILAGAGASIGATTITLSTFKDIDGTLLTMPKFGSVGYGTLEPNNATQEESISFTGITQNTNGTATLTGVKHVLFISPFTETSGTTKIHPGGVKFIITNTAGYYNQFAVKANTESITGVWTFDEDNLPRADADRVYGAGDELLFVTYAQLQSTSLVGVTDMSLTAKGIGEEATQAEIDAGTQTGTEGQLIVNPKYLKDSIYYTQLPSAGQKAGLAGSSGTPSATNKYITAADVSSVAVTGAVIRAYGTQLPALSGIQLVSTNITGLYITNQVMGDLLVKPSTAGWARFPTSTAGRVLVTTTATPGIQWLSTTSIPGLAYRPLVVDWTQSTSSTTGGEVLLKSISIPANTLGKNGGLRVTTYVSLVGSNAYFRAKFGSTTIDFGTINVGGTFIVEIYNRNNTSAQQMSLRGHVSNTASAAVYATATENTTTALTLGIGITSQSAGSSAFEGWTVELIK